MTKTTINLSDDNSKHLKENIKNQTEYINDLIKKDREKIKAVDIILNQKTCNTLFDYMRKNNILGITELLKQIPPQVYEDLTIIKVQITTSEYEELNKKQIKPEYLLEYFVSYLNISS